MKQGRADHSDRGGTHHDPISKRVNPGGVDALGYAHGNHATDIGTFKAEITPLYGGRGYHAPGIGTKTHPSGSQGKH